jgi:hypothetical protein
MVTTVVAGHNFMAMVVVAEIKADGREAVVVTMADVVAITETTVADMEGTAVATVMINYNPKKDINRLP